MAILTANAYLYIVLRIRLETIRKTASTDAIHLLIHMHIYTQKQKIAGQTQLEEI